MVNIFATPKFSVTRHSRDRRLGNGSREGKLPTARNKVFIVNHTEIKGKRKRSIYLIKEKKSKISMKNFKTLENGLTPTQEHPTLSHKPVHRSWQLLLILPTSTASILTPQLVSLSQLTSIPQIQLQGSRQTSVPG